MLSLCQINLLPLMLETIDQSRLLPFFQRYLRRYLRRSRVIFLKSNSLLPPSQFLYRRGLGICNALPTLSHHLQVALNSCMEGRLVQLEFSADFDRVGHRALLYKLRSIGAGRTVLVHSMGVP